MLSTWTSCCKVTLSVVELSCSVSRILTRALRLSALPLSEMLKLVLAQSTLMAILAPVVAQLAVAVRALLAVRNRLPALHTYDTICSVADTT